MFGKKKKLAEQKTEEQAVEEVGTPIEESEPAAAESASQDNVAFLDSDLFFDDEVEAEILSDEEAAQLEELQAVLMDVPPQEEAKEELAQEDVFSLDEEKPAEEQPEEAVEKEPAAEESSEEEPAAEEQPEAVEKAPAEEPESQEEAVEEAEEEPAEEETEEPAEEVTEEESEELEEEAEEEPEEIEETEEEVEEESEEGEDDESVVYVVDGPEEDDEVVHPAKLVKLPHLIDYMIAQGMSKNMKMKVALMLVQTYKKFKDSPEDNKICLQCMAKVMQELMKK